MHDPDIFSIREKFGNDGYVVFFGCLEFITRNYNQQNQDKSFTFPEKLLRKTFRISAQKFRNILTFKPFSERILSKIDGNTITLTCPKLEDMIEGYGRQKKYRDSHKLRNGCVMTTKKLHTEVEVEVDKEVRSKDIKKDVLSGSDKPDQPNKFSDFKKLVFAKWNEVASKNGLSTILNITKSREGKLKTRYDEGLFVQEVEKIFNEIEKSKLLLGKLDKPNPDHANWKITFDWLVDNDKNYLKILEGNYRDKNGTNEQIA